jgi:hypothetical protein
MTTLLETPRPACESLATQCTVPYAATLVHCESNEIPVCNHLGTPLANGCAVELGYFSKAEMAQPFRGLWTPLAGPCASEMNRTIALARMGQDGCKSGCFRWEHTFWQGVEHLPHATVPLALRFFDHANPLLARRYNTVSNPSWWFRAPKAPKPALVFVTLDFDGVMWESGPGDAFRTTLSLFGSLFSRLMAFGVQFANETGPDLSSAGGWLG